MLITTSDKNSVRPLLKKVYLPKPNSHKGQNGRVLIIGGSSLFHAASLWAAEVSSHFADMVHYCSTKENERIFLALKERFINGMIVPKKELLHYVAEDDAILVGPGMMRKPRSKIKDQRSKFEDIIREENEAAYTYYLTQYLIERFPEKKFVFDAGALQMMDPNGLLKLKEKPIITPHQKEFERLFGVQVTELNQKEKIKTVEATAKAYNCIVFLKAIDDIISDGITTYIVRGGNQGLTKGGTGDVLAGLVVSLFSKNDGMNASVLSSYILKKTSDLLFSDVGYWYNVSDIIKKIPVVTKSFLL